MPTQDPCAQKEAIIDLQTQIDEDINGASAVVAIQGRITDAGEAIAAQAALVANATTRTGVVTGQITSIKARLVLLEAAV